MQNPLGHELPVPDCTSWGGFLTLTSCAEESPTLRQTQCEMEWLWEVHQASSIESLPPEAFLELTENLPSPASRDLRLDEDPKPVKQADRSEVEAGTLRSLPDSRASVATCLYR